MCDKTDDTSDTGAFLAVRYEHLDGNQLKLWLKELNEWAGWLKQNFKGHGVMQVFWSGGMPGRIDWFVNITRSKPKKPKKNE